MPRIPQSKGPKHTLIPKINREFPSDSVVFSFAIYETNEFFNLDATCQNWSADLFNIMKTVSSISKSEIDAGRYSSGKGLRIHNHRRATNIPCTIPNNISKDDLYQIRISQSKGGIHGVFSDNVFYVLWCDPHHNFYPNENYGGIKKIVPPDTCCKDRDQIIIEKDNQISKLQSTIDDYKKILEVKTAP